MRAIVVVGLALVLSGAALAQGGPGVMADPGAHPEGDGMIVAPRDPAGLPFRPETPEDMASRCGADRLQHLVGGRWPVELLPRRGPLRVIRTGDPVTMDHNRDRLNIQTDQAGNRVVAVYCG